MLKILGKAILLGYKVDIKIDKDQANYDEVKTQLFRDCFVIDVVVMLF